MTTATVAHVHHDDPDTVGRRERLGVLLLIVADIAFVACLMFTYLYLRFLNVNGMWMPEEIKPALNAPTWIVNALIVAGAVIFTVGVRTQRRGGSSGVQMAGWLAFLLALAALVVQIGQMVTFNFPAAENGRFLSAYSSSLVGLAGANAFHLLLTVFICLGIAIRSTKGKYLQQQPWQPRLVMYWWMWVAISAVMVGLMTTFFIGTPYPASMP